MAMRIPLYRVVLIKLVIARTPVDLYVGTGPVCLLTAFLAGVAVSGMANMAGVSAMSSMASTAAHAGMSVRHAQESHDEQSGGAEEQTEAVEIHALL